MRTNVPIYQSLLQNKHQNALQDKDQKVQQQHSHPWEETRELITLEPGTPMEIKRPNRASQKCSYQNCPHITLL